MVSEPPCPALISCTVKAFMINMYSCCKVIYHVLCHVMLYVHTTSHVTYILLLLTNPLPSSTSLKSQLLNRQHTLILLVSVRWLSLGLPSSLSAPLFHVRHITFFFTLTVWSFNSTGIRVSIIKGGPGLLMFTHLQLLVGYYRL